MNSGFINANLKSSYQTNVLDHTHAIRIQICHQLQKIVRANLLGCHPVAFSELQNSTVSVTVSENGGRKFPWKVWAPDTGIISSNFWRFRLTVPNSSASWSFVFSFIVSRSGLTLRPPRWVAGDKPHELWYDKAVRCWWQKPRFAVLHGD
jgi:hypothetical protein